MIFAIFKLFYVSPTIVISISTILLTVSNLTIARTNSYGQLNNRRRKKSRRTTVEIYDLYTAPIYSLLANVFFFVRSFFWLDNTTPKHQLVPNENFFIATFLRLEIYGRNRIVLTGALCVFCYFFGGCCCCPPLFCSRGRCIYVERSARAIRWRLNENKFESTARL